MEGAPLRGAGPPPSRFARHLPLNKGVGKSIPKLLYPLRLRPSLHHARQRDLFGFPPVGSEYWNAQTLRDVQTRYPEMDLAPYGAGVTA